MRLLLGTITLVLATAVAFGVLAGGATSSPGALDARNRCVRGDWKMSNAASNAVLQSLINTPTIRIARGVITASFARNGVMRYGSTDFVVRVDGGSFVMTGTGTFIFEANWSTSGDRLIVSAGRSEVFISKLTATKDGQTITIDGPGATVKRTPRAPTPYTCRGDTLRWKIPLNNTWTLFRRVD